MNFIAGIGASAGGLDALCKFFMNMPPIESISFIVAQHFSSDYKNLMNELLEKVTARRIFIIEDGMEVLPGCIYLIPPQKEVKIVSNILSVKDFSMDEDPSYPTDIFFESLAIDKKEAAIAIVMSGAGDDGIKGVSAIKRNGGFVMAQDPTSAQFSSMPQNAVNTGYVDYVISPLDMGGKLYQFIENYDRDLKYEDSTELKNYEKNIMRIYSLVEKAMNLDLTYYKQNTLYRRIERRMKANGIPAVNEYYEFLKNCEGELKNLCDDVLIGVTQFFRDIDSFRYIENTVIPQIFKQKNNGEAIRVWVSSCSTGEEAYSIAILFCDYMKKHKLKNEIRIFASDIDSDSLAAASAGIYGMEIEGEVPEKFLSEYFEYTGNGYELTKEVRNIIVFSKHNLIKDPPFNKIDLLCCRNMLIYLQPVMQKKVLSIFNYAVNREGYLFLGASETIGEFSEMFTPEQINLKIFKHNVMPQTPKVEFDSLSIRTLSKILSNEKIDKNGSKHYWHELYKILVKEYMPSSVIVDANYNVVLTCGKANEYLEVPKGEITTSLTDMVNVNVASNFISALRRAFKEGQGSKFVYELMGKEGDFINIEVSTKVLKDLNNFPPMAVILFVEQGSKENEDSYEDQYLITASEGKMEELQSNLHQLREDLQIRIGESERYNEELQVANEELLSSNEELQSANDELHAVNEELVTLNSEYQLKIAELSELNNDLYNFLNVTNIGVLFLDNKLNIRKFTDAAAEIVNLIKHDIGRPVSHISTNLLEVDIVEVACRVLQTLLPIEKEVLATNNQVFIMKAYPYRTREDFIKGVTVTFVNVTEMKNAQIEIKGLKNNGRAQNCIEI